jgi:hypothetical protein
MSHVREVHDRLEPLLRDRECLDLTCSLTSKIRDWVYFAQRYCAAAVALEDAEDTHIHPRIQLYGHAIECALKACLVAKRQPIPKGNKGHDLINLATLVEQHGYYVTEAQAIAIVQVSSLFYMDIGSKTLFKARYPIDKAESRESIVGDFEAIHDLIESLCTHVRNLGRLG